MAKKEDDQLKVFRTLNELNPDPYPYLCLSGKNLFIVKKFKAQTFVVFKNIRGVQTPQQWQLPFSSV